MNKNRVISIQMDAAAITQTVSPSLLKYRQLENGIGIRDRVLVVINLYLEPSKRTLSHSLINLTTLHEITIWFSALPNCYTYYFSLINIPAEYEAEDGLLIKCSVSGLFTLCFQESWQYNWYVVNQREIVFGLNSR